MRTTLDESQPIFQQIAQMIMDEIVEGELREGEQAPSENELSQDCGGEMVQEKQR